jgi:hypothetical protein
MSIALLVKPDERTELVLSVQSLELFHQLFFRFLVVRVGHDALYWANRLTFGRIRNSHALRALFGVYDIDRVSRADRVVDIAFLDTHIARSAIFCNL